MAANRKVGVAVDFSPCSIKALQWTLDNVVRQGDYLVLVTISPDKDSEQGEIQLWEDTGSPLVPLAELLDPAVMKKYAVKPPQEALDLVQTAATQKKIEVLMKIHWGDPREKICEAVDRIPLDCLTMGYRGLGALKRALMGSVSNYVVNNASCPVIVVKTDSH